MKLLVAALILGLAAAPKVAAVEASKPLVLKSKSAIAATTASAPHNYAPFVAPADEPDLDLLPPRDLRQDQSRSS